MKRRIVFNITSILVAILSLVIFTPTIYAEELKEDLSQYRTEENKVEGEPYLNPKWIEWNNLSNEEKVKWEVIPEKLIVDFIYEEDVNTNVLKPFSYNYYNDLLIPKTDSYLTKYSLKEEGFVSPVKNQSTLGLCWSFASVGAIESNALKTLGKSLIFSERQIDYVVSDPATSISEGYNPYGDSNQVLGNGGGHFEMAVNAFQSGISPVLTNQWGSYNTSLTKKNLSQVINTTNVAYQVTNTIDFPRIDMSSATQEEKDAYIAMIKEHILNYGGVYLATITPDSRGGTCYNSQYNMSYKYDGCTHNENDYWHAMLIIGWNDTYGPDYNGDGVGDGAWLLKNSWGSQNQYPYASYYSLDSVYNGVVSIQEKDWNRNYDFTDIGKVVNGTRVFYKDPDSSENLKRISFYNQYSFKNNIYKVYVSYSGNENDKTYIGEVVTNNPGVYSIDVKNIILNKEKFKIYIENETTNRVATEINAYSSIITNLTDEKAITILKDNYVSYDSSKTSNSFDLYSITENIITGKKLTYKFYDSNGEEITSLFSMDNSYIVNGNQKNLVTFNTNSLNLGNYTVKTYLNDKLLNTNEFEIGTIRIDSIDVSNYYIQTIVGNSGKISPTILPTNAYNKVLNFESENPNIVTINSDGTYIALSVGETKIKISTTDGSNLILNIKINVMEGLKGAGTLENPYKIYNQYDLNLIRYSTSSYYELKNDIVFSDLDYELGEAFYNNGNYWTPIYSFSGVLEGNGYSIENLKISDTNTSGLLGMFKNLSNAVIKNIIFSDSSVINNNWDYMARSNNYNGILAGRSSKSTIMNVQVNNSVVNDMDDDSDSYSGALLGDSNYDDIINCSSKSSMISKYAAGLIGETTYSFIYNSFSEANLKAPNMGGIVYKATKSAIMDSYSISTFDMIDNDYTKYVGGITGISSNNFYWNVYSINDFNNYKEEMDVYIGGISGKVQYTTKMHNTFAN